MRSWSKIHSRSGSREGIALVLTLAFIVLLTLLIVSFIAFTRLNRLSTASYSKSIQAQEVAEGGLQEILFDLHSEIAAGSLQGSAYTQGTYSYASVYIPTTNLAAEPARIGYANASYTNSGPTTTLLSPTLIRVSRATGNGGDSFFTAPPAYYTASQLPINRASNVPTTNISVNGRSISAARWNKTYLLAAPASTIPLAFGNAPPDWVYVTRTGSRVCNLATDTLAQLLPSSNLTTNYGTIVAGANPPASPVVGRYAFIMYDEGSLLDANVAGYVAASTNIASVPATNNPAGITQAVYGKSYLSYADLTQIPGFAAAGFSAAKQAQIDGLVNWRNASAAATAGAALTGPNYLTAVFNNAQNGFLAFASTSAGGSDSPFVGRQDLINYFASIDATPTTTSLSQALPYLGTFSRALNWPSWHPTMDSTNMPGFQSVYQSGKLGDAPGASTAYGWTSTFQTDYLSPNMASVAYQSQMENAASANRDLPNVRYSLSLGAGTAIQHYNDSGIAASYTVNPGDPLLQHRFSLAKLGWFNSVDPRAGPTANTTALQACFGLVWGADVYGNPCWLYAGSSLNTSGGFTSSTARSSIETLDQVAAENPPREPNFFELLKAGILSGSLGKEPGPAVGLAGSTPAATVTQTPGFVFPLGSNPSFSSVEGILQVNHDTYFAQKDMHVLQIGANIIDQYDTDSYPTAIHMNCFTPESNSSPETGPINTVYGIENLPYFTRIYPVSWVTPQGSASGVNGMNVWLVPEVWQPFQQPTVTTKRPTQFCVRAYGNAVTSWNQPFDYPPATNPNWTPYKTGETSAPVNYDAGGTESLIYFKDLGNTFYNSPVALTVNLDNGTDAVNKYPASPPFNNTTPPSTAYQFMGIHAGWAGPFNLTTTINTTAPLDMSQAFDYSQDDQSRGAQGKLIYAISTYTAPNPLITLCLQYSPDGSAPYLPYAYWSRLGVGNFNAGSTPNGTTWGSGTPLTTDSGYGSWRFMNYVGNTSVSGMHYLTWKGDALTDRFGSSGVDQAGGAQADNASLTPSYTQNGQFFNDTWQYSPCPPLPGSGPGGNPAGYSIDHGFPARSSGFFYHSNSTLVAAANSFGSTGSDPSGLSWPQSIAENLPNNPEITGGASAYLGCWAENEPQQPSSFNGVAWTLDAFYADNDGVIRPGNDVARNITTGDGCSMIFGASTTTEPTGAGNAATTQTVGRRPLVLNRPFRSVGELGYAYRDLPFKSLDFFTTYSADSALLDLFSVTDEPSVVAGEVDLSNASQPVIQAVISGGNKEELSSTYTISSSSGELLSMAKNIATKLNGAGTNAPNPLMNRADLVNSFGLSYNTNSGVITGTFYNSFSKSWDQADKSYLEAPVRAMSGVTNTRTWNLLIDIIAQSGHLAPTAAKLGDFVVEGEKRYWLHIAIDRYTGKIIDQQLEPAYE